MLEEKEGNRFLLGIVVVMAAGLHRKVPSFFDVLCPPTKQSKSIKTQLDAVEK